MSNYGNVRNGNFIEKEQVFFKVFGCGTEVKLLTATLPAGMPYEDRIALFKKMDKHIKSVGGKLLKDGFWNATPRPSDPPTVEPTIEEDVALPF